jgi:uncharacterized protein YprB with RNaseH-like and TPR domain
MSRTGILTMTAVHAPARMGALWQQRMEALREYEVIRDGNIFGTSLFDRYLFSSEYDRAQEHLSRLEKTYEGVPLSKVFAGRELENAGGVCLSLESRHPLPCRAVDSEKFRSAVLADLTLVHGIGEATQRRLKARGYQTLYDLAQTPKFRKPAIHVINHLDAGNSADLISLIGRRHARSHPLVLGTAGFHEPEEYVFLDIETLGLFSRPIILFGVGVLENGRLVVHQYLLRDIDEEPAALVAACDHLSGDRPALVTFNGKSFDLPYLQDRLAYYGMGSAHRIPHFDILFFSRRRWRDQFSSLRLSVLEKEVLGIRREDDVPGQMVPEFYEKYLQTKNCGPLVPIVEHNKQDVVSLAMLFFRLLEDYHGCC